MSEFDDVSTERKIDNILSALELIESGNSDKLREMLVRGEISYINASVPRDGQMFTLLTTASALG